jgi:hypothetical protein
VDQVLGRLCQKPLQMAAEPGPVVKYRACHWDFPYPIVIENFETPFMKVQMPQGMNMTNLIAADLMTLATMGGS